MKPTPLTTFRSTRVPWMQAFLVVLAVASIGCNEVGPSGLNTTKESLLSPTAETLNNPSPSQTPSQGFTTVRIKSKEFKLEIANTPRKQFDGLGFRDSMPRDMGMLFIFPSEDYHSIWMRGMRFPLDILWISTDKTIVKIQHRTPTEPATDDGDLTIYSANAKVRYIIEFNAGTAMENNINEGDDVEF